MTRSVKPLPELKRRVLSKKQLNCRHLFQGDLAEKRASAFLKKQGYLLLEANLRFKNLEIDLIALDQRFDEIVFVEVKWRANSDFGDASTAVDWRKLKKMQTVGEIWLRKQKFQKAYRFDIISLVGNLKSKALRIRHFENVTWL